MYGRRVFLDEYRRFEKNVLYSTSTRVIYALNKFLFMSHTLKDFVTYRVRKKSAPDYFGQNKKEM
jgi:hypothetical protein